MNSPLFTEVVPGLRIDLYRYDQNPYQAKALASHYYDGYWEMVITVTSEHLSVPPQVQKALFVMPKSGPVDHPIFDEEHTVFALDVTDSPTSITWTYGQMPSPRVRPDADIIVIGISAEEEYKQVILALEHEDHFLVPESMQHN